MSQYEDLQAQSQALEVSMREELARVTGLDVAEFHGLSAEDLQAVHEQVLEETDQAQAEAQRVRHLADQIAASHKGVTVQEMRDQQEMDAAKEKARNGSWSDYLKVKYERGQVDRSAAQEQGSREQWR